MKDNVYYLNCIGTDEVGTGDYFGPIIVTAAYVTNADIPFLEKLNTIDSKKLSNKIILKMVPKLLPKIKFKTLILNNKVYNNYYSNTFNLNKIKAILHNQVILLMKKEIKNDVLIMIDQFTPPDKYFNYLKEYKDVEKNVNFSTKGESVHLAVACASLISKFYFILEMNKLSYKLGIKLPYGSNENTKKIKEKIIEKFNYKTLKSVAKINFQ